MPLMLTLLTLASQADSAPDPWAADFEAQRPSARPRLECRYTDASRQQAEIIGQDYRVVLHMGDGRKHQAVVSEGGRETARLTLEVESGKTYSSLRTTDKSRLNLYRRGPYYLEVHWFDVRCADEAGAVFPAKGEVVLYCYPEKVNVQAIWHAVEGAEGVEPGTARIAVSDGRSAEASFGKLKAGDKVSAAMPLVGEPDPPPADTITLLEGVDAKYDSVRGCYMVRTDNPGGFSYHYYEDPNHYETARFKIRNDGRARKVYVCHATRKSPGSVECGVVLDAQGHPLPLMVQISKNFSGEKEEKFYNPTDIPFSETFFPLHLAPNEERELTSLHLYQNWGNHPLKQFSSLGAWMDYYHSSTGVTETTCFVPFKFGGLPGVAIADLRPMSQRMWKSQPQHDNVAGHRFLMVRHGGKWHYSKYEGTTFRSTGPNWMDISLDYTSDDGTMRARLDSFELPQTDELRNFVHLRVDVLRPITVENLGTDFRLVDITTRIQRLRYTHAAWQGKDGATQQRAIEKGDGFLAAGEALGGEFPWATLYGDKRGCNSFVVRSYRSRLGGEQRRPAVCVQTHKSGDTNLALTVLGAQASLNPGDFVEVALYLMPYGNDEDTYETPERDRVPFGENAPRVASIARGTKLADFPTRLRADETGEAEFTVTGGVNYIPLLVEGLPTYKNPQLEVRTDGGKWERVAQGTKGKDGYQVFVAENGTFGCVFLVKADGEAHTYRASSGRANPKP